MLPNIKPLCPQAPRHGYVSLPQRLSSETQADCSSKSPSKNPLRARISPGIKQSCRYQPIRRLATSQLPRLGLELCNVVLCTSPASRLLAPNGRHDENAQVLLAIWLAHTNIIGTASWCSGATLCGIEVQPVRRDPTLAHLLVSSCSSCLPFIFIYCILFLTCLVRHHISSNHGCRRRARVR